jgi:hypothetical protein
MSMERLRSYRIVVSLALFLDRILLNAQLQICNLYQCLSKFVEICLSSVLTYPGFRSESLRFTSTAGSTTSTTLGVLGTAAPTASYTPQTLLSSSVTYSSTYMSSNPSLTVQGGGTVPTLSTSLGASSFSTSIPDSGSPSSPTYGAGAASTTSSPMSLSSAASTTSYESDSPSSSSSGYVSNTATTLSTVVSSAV